MSARTAICEAIELPAKGAPEWVHLLPRGAVNGRDGRRWRLDDPAAVIARSAKDGDLPIDYDHESEKPKAHGGPLPAAGWIKELQSRADGIWGRVEWTGRATELIAGREYRFLSPVLHYHPVTGQVMRLTGAGLVHRPNLALTALSEQEMTMTAPTTDSASPDLARIADALGLDDSADTDAILTAINAIAAPDPARFVPIEAVADLLKQRNSAASDNARAAAEAQVEKAMNAGYLTPAMRNWAVALCTQDPGSFDSFVSSSIPLYAHLHRRSGLDNKRLPDATRPMAGDSAAICAQLGLSPDDLK